MANPKHEPTGGDPLIEEVRAIRKELSDRFGNDPARLCAHLREIESQHAERVVRPPGDQAATR